MNDEALTALCNGWMIDKDQLLDAVTACQMAIAKIVPNHPQCRDMHVGIVICAASLSNIKDAAGPAMADGIAGMLGAELFALVK